MKYPSLVGRSSSRGIPPVQSLWTFALVWMGQSVSLFGSSLTAFALGLWVYTRTGSVLQFGLIALSASLPQILLSPLAGTLADRFDRRILMIFSDLGAATGTLAIAVLWLTGQLEVPYIYLATAVSAAFGAFQWPAYTSATAQIVRKGQLGQANGLVQFGSAAVQILTPAAAGFLVKGIGVPGVLVIDFATFLFAVTVMTFLRFPPFEKVTLQTQKSSLLREAAQGWQLIRSIPGLTGLLGFVIVFNFIWGMVSVLVAPMVLSFADARTLGVVLMVAGAGILTGSLVMSTWGGPQRKLFGLVLFELASGVCFIFIGLRPWAGLVAAAAFGAHFTIAMIEGSNKAIWQTRIPPEAQGRAFAAWQMAAQAARPLAYLTAGPLADRLFNPLLAPGGALAASLGTFMGSGAGRGIGLMFVVMGLAKIAASLACGASPSIRALDRESPARPKAEAASENGESTLAD